MRLEDTPAESYMLSKRIQRACDGSSLLEEAFYQQTTSNYHPTTNPRGIINLGTAENKIVFDMIQEKISSISFKSFPEKYSYYCNFTGVSELRDKLSDFVNHYMKPTIKTQADNIFVLNGGGPAIETLGFAFCDEGETIMTPAPYYGAFSSDLYRRFGTLLLPIHLSSNGHSPYHLSVDKLRATLVKSKRDGIKVKALMLTNPNNPTGIIYSISEMESYAQFCYENNIHLICDEMYFFSTFDTGVSPMNSILSLENFQKYRDIIHVIWGFSKDFGLSGFRCGMIITYKHNLKICLNPVCMFSALPTTAQYIFIHLVSDFDWIDRFVKTNRKRLSNALNIVIDTLNEIDIPYIRPSGGLFVWINIQEYLQSETMESERELFQDLMRNGIYMAPGIAFSSREFGWFRIVMSVDELELKLGLKRFKQTLSNMKLKKRRLHDCS